MARLARLVFGGYPHHLLQRGNYDQIVFETVLDYSTYLDWLRQYSLRFRIEIWAYCLMPNHVHLICVPVRNDDLGRAFNALHMRYAQYINAKKKVLGHLWRARFQSCALDKECLKEDVRFIENNPVRKGLAERAEDYPWSSARGHVYGQENPVLSGDGCLKTEIGDWGRYLKSDANQMILSRVRMNLKTGRPAGNAAFVKELERISGRRLEAMPRGRPRKCVARDRQNG